MSSYCTLTIIPDIYIVPLVCKLCNCLYIYVVSHDYINNKYIYILLKLPLITTYIYFFLNKGKGFCVKLNIKFYLKSII